MTLRADDLAHSDESELDRLWERVTRPITDGASADDAAEWEPLTGPITDGASADDAAEWERLTRPIPDGAIAGDATEWDSIIFEIAEALDPGHARVPGRHARRGAACPPEGGAVQDAGGNGSAEFAP